MKKRIFILIIICFIVAFFQTKVVSNASGLVVMKDHLGNNMTYFNSNEPVYQLSEYNYPTNQLRAVWVSMFVSDLPRYENETKFKQDATTLLDNMQKMGLNAMIYHLRTHNNALYKSELNPVATWYSKVNFDEFDPTKWLIDECHKRGIEFHAWLNPYRISTNGTTSQFVSGQIPANNPVNSVDNLIITSTGVILDPGIPKNREFIIDTCMEIVENYDVDAIHFDDYFYINGADDSKTYQKYNTDGLSIGDFRRKQVDLFIEALSNELRNYNKLHHKTIQLGISPSGIYRNGGYNNNPQYNQNGDLISPLYSNTSGFSHYDNYLYSDTLNWINHEWIDYIMPQCYWAIEHNEARYTEVVRWWNWAVKNKKVNLYTGLGIYMAAENSNSGSYKYWQYNDNEIQKQLLYSAQYDTFDGVSFYKYASLLNTNISSIKNTVDLISNDYWNKAIPGAVQKYYAPLLDTIKPTNVVYNSTNQTIEFDELENIRGYMIYQVEKNQVLDQSNINHLYQYINKSSIKISDLNKDYYVATVNLANEVSEAVKVNLSVDASYIVNQINQLPDDITYKDINQVKILRNLYNNLPLDEQNKVNNLNILQAAEAKIAIIENNLEILDNYIKNLDLHIKTNRVLPKEENISLAYKNESDNQIYNLETGVRLKNYLNVKELSIIATYNKDSVLVSKEFKINVGYLSTNQIGLFYRNDPSSMGKDDEGLYNEASDKFIGWSNNVVVVDNYVLFIADKNYIEITDENNIPKCNFVSVCGTYVNKTGKQISLKLTNAFDTKSSNDDGYFIISQNKIKTINSTWDQDWIILENNESLVILRYLDSMITGNIMSPVSNLKIGQTAYINQPTTSEEDDPINQIRQQYIKKIDDLVASYIDVSTLEKEQIDKLAINFKTQMNQATKESDIEYLWTRAKATINDYLDNLEASRTKVKNRIDEYLTKLNYVQKELDYLKQLATSKKQYVDEVADIEVILSVVDEFINLVNQHHTDLEKSKKSNLENLENLIKPWYTKKQTEYINQLKDVAKNEIVASGTNDEINLIVTKLNSDIANYLESLEKAIDEGYQYLNQIETYQQNKIILLVNNTKTALTNAKTTSEAEQIIKTFDIEYQQILTKKYQISFETNSSESLDNQLVTFNTEVLLPTPTKPGYIFNGWYYNNLLVESGKWQYTTDVILVAKWEIDQNADFESLKTSYLTKVENFKTKTSKAESFKIETINNLKNAKSKDEVESIMNLFNDNIDNYNKINCFNSSYYIYSLLLFTSLIALKRKKN